MSKTVLILIILASLSVSMQALMTVNATNNDFLEVLSQTACGLDTKDNDYRLMFSDGQVLDAQVNRQDACRYGGGEINADEFMAKIKFTPVTRGPQVWPVKCTGGLTCRDGFECSCRGSQECSPQSENADARGCVESRPPAHAVAVGGGYACKPGYVWSQEGKSCVEAVACGEDEAVVENRCQPIEGKKRASCLPVFNLVFTASTVILTKIL